MSDTSPIIISHSNCNDGLAAVWAAKRKYPEAEIHFRQYGDPVGDIEYEGRDVIMVDFSFDREVLIEMNEKAKSLLVLDHHKTAQERLEGLPFAIFDMERSGAGLAYDHLLGDGTAPPVDGRSHRHWLVDYVEDRDLWRFDLAHSKAINAGIASYPRNLESWEEMSKRNPQDLRAEGYTLLRSEDGAVKALARFGAEREIEGHKVLVVNSSSLQSRIGEELAQGRPFGVVYFLTGDGDVVVSLRSRGETGIDVSKIAKKFGGGGHARAAGFKLSLDDARFIIEP
jgi:oligoribonuclease NrnB/cAMP/cGMP phosphodiesterase (DHH superfamily)